MKNIFDDSLENNVPDSRRIYSISEITSDLKQLIEDNFSVVWLRGEISNFKAYGSGHYYFNLKDEHSQINAVMFRGSNHLLKFIPENGMMVVVCGRLTLYDVRGQYQIIVTHLEPDGKGALQLAFEQLKKKLKDEGLFDVLRKKTLPSLPKRVGIVTSLHGAAIHDILSVLKRRYPGLAILIYPVKVQGVGSVEEIVRAISYFSFHKNVDVLIVGRGGGSVEDLWSFNEEAVARALFACPIPVISAVGHETDFTICDFVADLRAPTPSVAAELCVPVRQELEQRIMILKKTLQSTFFKQRQRLVSQVHYLKRLIPTPRDVLDKMLMRLSVLEENLYQSVLIILRSHRLKISEFSARLVSPQQQIRQGHYQLREQSVALVRMMNLFLMKQVHRLQQAQQGLDLLSPQKVLQRGYVFVKDANQQIIISKAQALKNQTLELMFADGELKVVVQKSNPEK